MSCMHVKGVQEIGGRTNLEGPGAMVIVVIVTYRHVTIRTPITKGIILQPKCHQHCHPQLAHEALPPSRRHLAGCGSLVGGP